MKKEKKTITNTEVQVKSRSTTKPTEEQLIEELADILLEGILWSYEHDTEYQQQNSSDILPGFDKGTG